MQHNIKIIMGLGNPGTKYQHTRHNIGFLVVDALVERHHASWTKKDNYEMAEIEIQDEKIKLIKPQTFMNSSGKIIPALLKQGVKAENLLVVHDELEKPFGTIEIKIGGSHRGHNGLRSIIEHCGPEFVRLRFGIGRPAQKKDVPDYVLSNFCEQPSEVNALIEKAATKIEQWL